MSDGIFYSRSFNSAALSPSSITLDKITCVGKNYNSRIQIRLSY